MEWKLNFEGDHLFNIPVEIFTVLVVLSVPEVIPYCTWDHILEFQLILVRRKHHGLRIFRIADQIRDKHPTIDECPEDFLYLES